MKIYDSTKDIRIVIRTHEETVVDTFAASIEVEDRMGRFVVNADEAALAAITPSNLILRRRDGSEVIVTVGWGTLTAVGHEARIVVDRADATFIEAMRVAV